MKRITTLLTVIIMVIALLCGCQDDDDKPTISLKPAVRMGFNSYDEFVQSITDGWFFDQDSSVFKQHIISAGYDPDNELDVDVKEKMAATSIIKPLVNGEELGWYADVNEDYKDTYLSVYYPYERLFQQSFNQGYMAYHLFQDSMLTFWVEYSFDVTSNEDFPKNEKANYNAVINGQNVSICYSQGSNGSCAGAFQYKNMYKVNISTENKELFDIVFSNLTIEEIDVK